MNYKKSLIALLAIMAVMGTVVQPVAAAGTLYVGTSSTNDAVTYDTLQAAVDNASNGDTIEVATGTYDTSIDVTTKNLTIVRDSSVTSGTVTINATNAKYGSATYGEYGSSLTLGTNVATNENIVTVDSANTANTGTYGTIQNAVDNSTANTTVEIVSGTYNTSINVTTEYLAFENADSSQGNVTIDASNTTQGNAFYGEDSDTVRVGQNLIVESSVYGFGSGAIGSTLTMSVLGIPLWALIIVALLVGFVGYKEAYQKN